MIYLVFGRRLSITLTKNKTKLKYYHSKTNVNACRIVRNYKILFYVYEK